MTKAAFYDVTVGQIGKREVDFVCEIAGERLYIQAAYMIPDDKVRDREFGNLLAIQNNFPKKVVSMDGMAGGSYRSIEHVLMEEFLLSLYWTQPRHAFRMAGKNQENLSAAIPQ